MSALRYPTPVKHHDPDDADEHPQSSALDSDWEATRVRFKLEATSTPSLFAPAKTGIARRMFSYGPYQTFTCRKAL